MLASRYALSKIYLYFFDTESLLTWHFGAQHNSGAASGRLSPDIDVNLKPFPCMLLGGKVLIGCTRRAYVRRMVGTCILSGSCFDAHKALELIAIAPYQTVVDFRWVGTR